MDTLPCTRCNEEKTIDEFPARNGKRSNRWCKNCRKEYARKHYLKNRQEYIDRAATYRHADMERNRVYQRRYTKRHKNRVDAKNARYREENRESLRDRIRNWKHAHPERVREQNRAWSKANPLKRAEYTRRRRARIYATRVGKVSYEAILLRDGWVCHICGGLIGPGELSFDHIVPLAKGGAHNDENISPAHLSCNLSKNASLVISAAPPRIRGRKRAA